MCEGLREVCSVNPLSIIESFARSDANTVVNCEAITIVAINTTAGLGMALV